jgi:hypothetical protein
VSRSGGVMPPGGSPGRRKPSEDAAPRTGRPRLSGASVFGGDVAQVLELDYSRSLPPDASEVGCRSVGDSPAFIRAEGPHAVGSPRASTDSERAAESAPAGRVERAPAVLDGTPRPAQGPPSAAVAHLDTLGVSRHPLETPKGLPGSRGQDLTPRARWARQVEALTDRYREQRAAELDRKARDARRRKRSQKCSDLEVKRAGEWYASRARGQRWRFRNAEGCGEGPKALRVACSECGCFSDHPVSCGVALVCLRCRGELQAKRRAEVGASQRVSYEHAKRLGFLRRNRKGGRWSDKFVTLTVPHMHEHSVGERVELIAKAWTFLLKRFNEWKRALFPSVCWCLAIEGSHRVHDHVRWYGSLEWTPGSDPGGHPHVHLWFMGPYLDQFALADWWRGALEKAGLGELEPEGRRIVRRYRDSLNAPYIQEAKDVRGGVYELVKYLVKDILDDGSLIAPERFAAAFEALDGRRLRRGSRGFLKLGWTPTPCIGCGVSGCLGCSFVEKKGAWLRTPEAERATAAPEGRRGNNLTVGDA